MTSMDSPHTKANLLLQAHFSGLKFPISDYYSDLKSVLDQSVRILQAMVDVCADSGWLFTTLNTISLMQMIMQGHWHDESPLLQLDFSPKIIDLLNRQKITCLPEILAVPRKQLHSIMAGLLTKNAEDHLYHVLDELPVVDIKFDLEKEYKCGSEVELTINLNRVSKYPKKGIHATKFPKRKEEGWWLILGNAHDGELLGLRRVNFTLKTTTKLTFDVPEDEGDYHYYLYFMSDSYIGLDQQYDVRFAASDSAPEQTKSDKEEDEDDE